MTVAWFVEYEPYYIGDELQGWTAQIARGAVGALSVEPHNDGSLHIVTVAVIDAVARQGAATALFNRVVAENPNVTRYTAHAETSFGRVFLEAMRKRHPNLEIQFGLTAGAELDP